MYSNLKKPNFDFEPNSGELHPEHEIVETSVVEFYRKFQKGQLDQLPQTHAVEMPPDGNDVDLLKVDAPPLDEYVEELDVVSRINEKSEDFKKAFEADKRVRSKLKELRARDERARESDK